MSNKPIENDNELNYNESINNDDDIEFAQVDEGEKNIPNKTFSISELKNKIKTSVNIKRRMSKSLGKLKNNMLYNKLNEEDENGEKLLNNINLNNEKDIMKIKNKNEQMNEKDEKNNIDNQINKNSDNIDDKIIQNNDNIDSQLNKNSDNIDNQIIKNSDNINNQINKNSNNIDNKIIQNCDNIDNQIKQNNDKIDNKIHQNNDKIDNKIHQNNDKIDDKINQNSDNIDNQLNQNNDDVDDKINQNNDNIDNQLNQNSNNIDNTNEKINNIQEDLNNNNENIKQEINKDTNIITKDVTKQIDTYSNKDNEITTENDDNFLIYESDLSNDLISNLKIGLSKSVATSNPEIILLIDASEEMENYINPLINKLCYNSLKKLGYDDKEKVHLFCFNSEDIDERHIQLYKLSTIKIIAEGKREVGELFDSLLHTIINKKGKNFRILFFFSGSIIWNIELFNSLKLFSINQDYNEIDCHVVKYIINDNTTFNEQDEILFKFLKSFSNKSNDISVLNADKIEDNINQIYELFKN